MTKMGVHENLVDSYTVGKPMMRRFQEVQQKFDLPHPLSAPPKNWSWILHQFILKKLLNTWVTQKIHLNRYKNLCKLPWP